MTNPAGQLVPWLATGYELSTDHRTFTFSLRPGVKFSNGKPLVADDVVFSINRTRKDAAGPLSFLDYAITDIEAKGTGSVVFQLSQPWAPFLSDLSVFANAVLPADFAGQSEKEFFTAPIGTGPFTLDGFTPDANSLTLKANPDYWQAGKPYLDSVEFLVRRQRQPTGAADPRWPGRHHRHGAAGQRFLAQGKQQPQRGPFPGLAGGPSGD